jgi:hypothetical protein
MLIEAADMPMRLQAKAASGGWNPEKQRLVRDGE